MTASSHRDQRKVSGPLLLEMWVTVSYPKWMLGLKLRFSGKRQTLLTCKLSFQLLILKIALWVADLSFTEILLNEFWLGIDTELPVNSEMR